MNFYNRITIEIIVLSVKLIALEKSSLSDLSSNYFLNASNINIISPSYNSSWFQNDKWRISRESILTKNLTNFPKNPYINVLEELILIPKHFRLLFSSIANNNYLKVSWVKFWFFIRLMYRLYNFPLNLLIPLIIWSNP